MTDEITEYDRGYAAGYNAGYDFAISDLIGVLQDNDHPESAAFLQSLLSPEGRRDAHERLKALYGSLAQLARESRSTEAGLPDDG